MTNLRSTVQKNPLRFALCANLVFCILSFIVVNVLGGGLVSIAVVAALFLLCQMVLILLANESEDITVSLLNHKVLSVLCFVVMLRTLMTLGQFWLSAGQAPNYAGIGIRISVLLFYGIACFFWLITRKELSYAKIYPVLCLVFGISIGIVFPPNTIADEPKHLRTAYYVSNIMIGVEKPAEGIYMRADDAHYEMKYFSYELGDMEAFYADLAKPLEDGKLILVADTGEKERTLEYTQRPAVFDTELYQYIIPAAGITAGRLLGLNTPCTYLLSRLFNLLFFTALITLAIKLIPIGKSIVFTAGLLPMTLQLAASPSREVFRITMAVLAFALTLYLFYDEERNRKYDKAAWAVLVIACAALFPLRTYVYSFISVLPVLIILYRKNILTGKMIRNLLIAACCAVVILLAVKYLVFPGDIVEVPKRLLSYTPEQRYTIQYFINHPLSAFSLLKNTFWTMTGWYYETMIGSQLGWLDYGIPVVFVHLFGGLLLFSALHRDYEKFTLPAVLRYSLIVFCILSSAAIMMGLALIWTPEGAAVIEGVQGRYFIPLIVPLLISFRTERITAEKKSDMICVCTQFAALIYMVEFLALRML